MLASRSHCVHTTSSTASTHKVALVKGSATAYGQMVLISSGGLQEQVPGSSARTGAQQCSNDDV
jgi:hypothetical protein